jgi:hypothetical protein
MTVVMAVTVYGLNSYGPITCRDAGLYPFPFMSSTMSLELPYLVLNGYRMMLTSHLRPMPLGISPCTLHILITWCLGTTQLCNKCTSTTCWRSTSFFFLHASKDTVHTDSMVWLRTDLCALHFQPTLILKQDLYTLSPPLTIIMPRLNLPCRHSWPHYMTAFH